MQRCLFGLMLLVCLMPLAAVHAQSSGNAICVVVFDDANGNNTQDAGETPLPGITVTVALETKLIVQSYITTIEPRPYCFNDLPDGNYILTFEESPNHRTLMQNSTAITLGNGQSAQVRFAAIPLPIFEDNPTANVEVNDSGLETPTRLALGFLGAMVVAILMMGMGMLIGVFLYR